MSWFNDFHLLRPWWLLALPLLFVFLHLQRHRLSRHSAWSQVIDPQLLPHLLNGPQQRNANHWLYPASLIAALLLVTALAGPSWRELPQPVFDAPLHRVIVMDLSPAMDAQDVKPSRLKRAQLLAQQLLDQQQEGDTGLVAFAASAFPVVPLTSARDTVSHLLHSLSPGIMPAPGNNLAAGIRQASDLLQQAGAMQGDIVVLTASPVNPQTRQAAKDALDAGYRLNILGAGTLQGAPVPAEGGWLKNAQGAIQLAKLDETALRKLAQNHGGRYQRVDQTDANFELAMNRLSQSAQQQQEQDFRADQWQDEGPWFLLPLLLMAALGFRRGWLMLLLLCVPLSVPQTAYAGWWQTDDQQAYQQYQSGAYEQAAEQFKNQNWQASALYQQGQYAQAAELWSQDDSAQADYNRGNALARSGDLDAAIQAYAKALSKQPNLADAQANKALLEKLKQQQDEQNQDTPEQQQDQNKNDPEPQDQSSQSDKSDDSQQQDSQQEQDQSSDAKQPQQQNQPDQSEEQQSDQEQKAQEAEESEPQDEEEQAAQFSPEEQQAKEQEQAVQQWLKRIPDDPGGLLRRKFERMEQRRQDAQR